MFQGFFEVVPRARIEELSKDQTVPEYASFANNKQTNRNEWTTCVANWKLCAEKPYVRPTRPSHRSAAASFLE